MNLPLVVGLILLALALSGFIGIKLLRVPDIVLYVLLGIGLSFFIHESEAIKVAGEIGMILLFFLLGMRYNIGNFALNIKKVWKAGTLDAFLGIVITTFVAYLFGLDFFPALIIGGIVYATSSSITAKLLEHSDRLQNRESEFMLSLLIFEDLVAPVLVTVLIGMSGESFTGFDFVFIFVKIAGLAAGAFVLSKIVFKWAEPYVKRIVTDDAFILLVVGSALAYGGVAVLLGLSEIIGAFLAGMILADVKVKRLIKRDLMPVRNLFLPFFFLHFGISMEFNDTVPSVGLLAVLLLWGILYKVLVGYYGGKWYGLEKKEAALAGFSFTPRGEFSVIIAGLATGTLQVFTGIYILAAAFIGMLIFMLAPKLTEKFFKNADTSTHPE
ncbi:cation:proton antiporter [Bacillus marinisedimentorum]|uniref:cation:proton antiporter n=1 Tax=Bacillus marinisedimentorum TaxID=1821260 RepID=UPI000872C3C6|nr:cation:proton antiporter [Bacillus marinisedimentorum]